METVMADRKISSKLKGKVLMCVTPAYLCSLVMVALTERHQRLQVCHNNWVRRIVAVKRVETSRMDELREEIGEIPAEMGWTLVRMEEERMEKIADRLREQCRRKRCRPWLRWEN